MNPKITEIISNQMEVVPSRVTSTITLLEEGATVPFIARYRKERTGSLDEVQILQIKELYEKFTELEKRKETVLKTISEQELLTPELKERIENCYDSMELEDIYLPFKPKRRTRATIARENGLEPLARIIMAQFEKDLDYRAKQYINEKVPAVTDALSGARDIMAEWISEDGHARNAIRQVFERTGVLRSVVVKGKEEEGIKYKDYFAWEEPLKKCPSHRLLAMRRGEKEGFLRVSVIPDEQQAVERLIHQFVKGRGASSDQVTMAVRDGFSRLLCPSIETEFDNLSKEKADKDAIGVFAENLRQLLLAPPLGQFRTLAIDPGYRTGCKVVCLDEQGNLLHNETIYPHPPHDDRRMAIRKLTSMLEAYRIEAIAIGNGTASRETEAFIKGIFLDKELKVFVVSEDGASVYSASAVAREEFPEYDVTVRGAVSIGRRLMDPLAELVKIDPKSIGVGQYQHDVDQKQLKISLDSVVESAVNSVGVNLNTASKQLLTYISGMGPQLAQNVVDFRKANGPFSSRKELMKVPRMGAKAFEQSAGFLRIPDASNPLDNSAVHPESYPVVEKIARDLKCTLPELPGNEQLLSTVEIQRYISESIGLPTLNDIMTELRKPGRDPRKGIKVFEFAEGIFKMEDLQVGMILPGIVNNITRFGAFVDIGVKQSGLVHLSEMANRFISDPNEVVKLHQHVRVKVIDIDLGRKRIQLSLKQVTE
jgi:protein Tex